MTSLASAVSARAEPAPVGDLDQVGQVEFLLRIVGVTASRRLSALGAGEGDRAGVAEPRRLLRRARILVLADRGETAVALDQAAVAGRIVGREAERDEAAPSARPRASPQTSRL